MNDIDVFEIPQAQLHIVLGLVGLLNPTIIPETLAQRLKIMSAQGYRCVGAYIGGDLVGVAGLTIGCKFSIGSYIEIDNLVVHPEFRGRGIGKRLMEWVHAEGIRCGCSIARLSSYINATEAHSFYESLGYDRLCYLYFLLLDAK